MTNWGNLSDEDIKIIIGKEEQTNSIMRDATKKEQESVNNYIKSISVKMIPITVLEDIKKELLEKTRHIIHNENTESFDEGIFKAIFVINKYIDETKEQPATPPKVINISYSPYTIDSTSNSYSVTISKTTEQPAAEWEWVQYESLPNFGNYHCSNCRHIEHKIDGYKYCPNCGSRMK